MAASYTHLSRKRFDSMLLDELIVNTSTLRACHASNFATSTQTNKNSVQNIAYPNDRFYPSSPRACFNGESLLFSSCRQVAVSLYCSACIKSVSYSKPLLCNMTPQLQPPTEQLITRQSTTSIGHNGKCPLKRIKQRTLLATTWNEWYSKDKTNTS